MIEYFPGIGLGEFRFGMPRSEVEAILGPSSPEEEPALEDLPWKTDEVIAAYKHHDSCHYAAHTHPLSEVVMTYYRHQLACIWVLDRKYPIAMNGIPISTYSQTKKLRYLSKLDSEAYFGGNTIYFATLGIELALPEPDDREAEFIRFTSPDGQAPTFKLDLYRKLKSIRYAKGEFEYDFIDPPKTWQTELKDEEYVSLKDARSTIAVFLKRTAPSYIKVLRSDAKLHALIVDAERVGDEIGLSTERAHGLWAYLALITDRETLSNQDVLEHFKKGNKPADELIDELYQQIINATDEELQEAMNSLDPLPKGIDAKKLPTPIKKATKISYMESTKSISSVRAKPLLTAASQIAQDEYVYTPQVGYGPFQFGMQAHEVHALLGKPERVFDSFKSMPKEFLEKSDIPFLKDHFVEDYANSESNNEILGIKYDPSGVVKIRIRDNKPFLYQGIDLFGRNRKTVVAALARLESMVYEDNESYYFPNSGIMSTKPKFWKDYGGIDFVKSAYIMKRLDYEDWTEADINRLIASKG